MTGDRAKPSAGTPGSRISIGKATPNVGHAGAPVESHQLDAPPVSIVKSVDDESAAAAVLDEVSRHLGGDEGDAGKLGVVEPGLARKFDR